MATQRDVQQLIQSIVPSAVNNGNPNTIYNSAPPTMDAEGNWFSSNLPTAASLTALQLQPTDSLTISPWTPPEGSGGGGLSFPGLPDLGQWTPPNGWTPNGGGGGGAGGGGGGRPNIPGNVPRTGTPVQRDTVRNLVPGTLSYDLTRDLFGPLSMAGMGVFDSFDGGGVSHMVGGNDFNMPAWQQILDAFIPGNAYLEGTGKWDFSNAGLGLIENYLGIPSGLGSNLIDFIVDRYGSFEQAPQWMQDHIKDNLHNEMANVSEEISAQQRKQGRDIMDKIMNEFAPQQTPTNRSPSNSHSAGSQTWLEGEGARDYVRSLHSPTTVMEGLRQQSIRSMDRMFKNQIR